MRLLYVFIPFWPGQNGQQSAVSRR